MQCLLQGAERSVSRYCTHWPCQCHGSVYNQLHFGLVKLSENTFVIQSFSYISWIAPFGGCLISSFISMSYFGEVNFFVETQHQVLYTVCY